MIYKAHEIIEKNRLDSPSIDYRRIVEKNIREAFCEKLSSELKIKERPFPSVVPRVVFEAKIVLLHEDQIDHILGMLKIVALSGHESIANQIKRELIDL